MYYKLTNEQDQTYHGFQWGPGVELVKPGGQPCSDQVVHIYTDPILAVMVNPIHGNYSDPHLWECEGDMPETDGLKVWGTRCKTIRQIDLPVVTVEQKVKFGILCAAQFSQSLDWLQWARNWWSGVDRTRAAAEAAWAEAAWTAAAAEAAWTAARAADAADAADATDATAGAAAAGGAACAVNIKKKIDFVKLAHLAIESL